jgi:hypothetical protein
LPVEPVLPVQGFGDILNFIRVRHFAVEPLIKEAKWLHWFNGLASLCG